MSETVLEQSLQLVLQETTAVAVVASLLAVGLVGVSLRILVGSDAGDDESPAGKPIGDGGRVVTEVVGDSTTADQTETTAGDQHDSDALEHRLDTLKADVETLFSTVKTVRNENDQISESVQEIEESTGQLVTLYERATRGVDPFSGEDDPYNPPPPENDRPVTDRAETAIADADSADRTDESTPRAEHCVDSTEEIVETETEPADAFEQRTQGNETDANGANDGVEEIDTSTFDENVGETVPEPADGAFGKEEMIDTPATPAPTASDGGTLLETQPERERESATESTTARTDTASEAAPESESVQNAEPTTKSERPTKPESESRPSWDVDSDTEGPSVAASADSPDHELTTTVPGDRAISSADGKPYLTSIPDGFAAEVITVEWLEYLVEELGVAGTVRALQYYEKIDWLTEDAAEELGAYLDGFDVAQKGTLSVEHHRQTLEYVEELTVTGAVPDDIAESD